MAVEAVISGLPGLAGVGAEGGAAAARFVRAPRCVRVPGERVHVRLRTGTVILPAPPAVGRAHQAAELDPDQQQVGVVRAGCDPAHVRCPRARREAPVRPRGQLEQRFQLAPALASVIASEQPARLGARVDRPVGGAHGEREHSRLGQPAVDPALDRRRRCDAPRPYAVRHTRRPGRPGRRPGTAHRFQTTTAQPSTRRPAHRGGRSRPRSRHTGARLAHLPIAPDRPRHDQRQDATIHWAEPASEPGTPPVSASVWVAPMTRSLRRSESIASLDAVRGAAAER